MRKEQCENLKLLHYLSKITEIMPNLRFAVKFASRKLLVFTFLHWVVTLIEILHPSTFFDVFEKFTCKFRVIIDVSRSHRGKFFERKSVFKRYFEGLMCENYLGDTINWIIWAQSLQCLHYSQVSTLSHILLVATRVLINWPNFFKK